MWQPPPPQITRDKYIVYLNLGYQTCKIFSFSEFGCLAQTHVQLVGLWLIVIINLLRTEYPSLSIKWQDHCCSFPHPPYLKLCKCIFFVVCIKFILNIKVIWIVVSWLLCIFLVFYIFNMGPSSIICYFHEKYQIYFKFTD